MKSVEKRIRRIRGLGYLLQLVPYCSAVILTGSMSFGAAKPSSDIDLLIITARDRLYTVRFFVAIWSLLTGHRRKPFGAHVAGKFCINHFMDESVDEILPKTKANARAHRFMIKIWDRQGEFERLMRENFWMRKYNLAPESEDQLDTIRPHFPISRPLIFGIFRRFGEIVFYGKVGDIIEKKMASWQKRKIISSLDKISDKSNVYVSDEDLRMWGREYE